MVNVNDIVEGKVTGITAFGAFVQIQDGTTGLIHISEISTGYVSDINDYLKVGQTVKAVALSVEKDGKLSLS
jgi:S1 RNA binding domain protein